MDRPTYIKVLETHRDQVYRYALFSLRQAEDAEDVTQEAFLRLWRSGSDLPPDRCGPWLMRVVRNLCVDWARRRQSQRRNFGQPDTEAVDRLPANEEGDHAPDGGLSNLTERQADLLAALDTLTPQAREVVLMHYFQGLKLREIAQILDRKVSSVKVQVHRARKALRLVLDAAAPPALAQERETG